MTAKFTPIYSRVLVNRIKVFANTLDTAPNRAENNPMKIGDTVQVYPCAA